MSEKTGLYIPDYMIFLFDHNMDDLYDPTGRLYTRTMIN